MPCKYDTGDVVLVNDSAEIALKYIGQTAIVIDTLIMGIGSSKPIEYDNTCLLTLQMDDGAILENVPESELSSL